MSDADEFFIFTPCKSEGSLQAVLRKPFEFDLKKLSKRLQEQGFDAVLSDSHLLVMSDENFYSVFPNGKLLAKTQPSKEMFKKFALKVYSLARRD